MDCPNCGGKLDLEVEFRAFASNDLIKDIVVQGNSAEVLIDDNILDLAPFEVSGGCENCTFELPSGSELTLV